jgi:aconitate hydratase
MDLTKEPLGTGKDGKPVYLKDIWPSNKEIADTIRANLTPEMYRKRYSAVFEGPSEWKQVKAPAGEVYQWRTNSTYVKYPTFFEGMTPEPGAIEDVIGARPLLILGDSITTDHISPAGSIKRDGPAGNYLMERQVRPNEFNSYGSRRGNHEVMVRGTFANIRIKNEMVPGTEGGVTKHMPSGQQMSVYDASMKYQAEGVPLIVVAGKEYGTGSSRDWAAKGVRLLGVRAAIAESFERIHRSNLIGMGVLPLEFPQGVTRKSLNLDGSETFDITGIAGGITPRMKVKCKITRINGSSETLDLVCRIDTLDEVEYYRHGGILQYVLRNMLKAA